MDHTIFLGSRGICFMSIKTFDSLILVLGIYPEEIIQSIDKVEGTKSFSEALLSDRKTIGTV